MLTLEYAIFSDRGLVRTDNQDRILACIATPTQCTFEIKSGHREVISEVEFFGALVADGVGSSSDGGKAAGAIQENFQTFWNQVYRSKRASRDDILETLLMTHQKILAENLSKAENSASTIVLLHLTENFAYILNVGDSRGYLLQQGAWKQLTTDDTIVDSKMLASVIGPGNKVSPHLIKYPVQSGDFFLLCSDGLDSYVPPQVVFSTILEIPSRSLGEISEKLNQKALQKGGRDNCSFVMVRILHLQEQKEEVTRLERKEEKPKTQKIVLEETMPIKNYWTDEKLFFEKKFQEQQEEFRILKLRYTQLETKIFYLLGIFGVAQLILLFVFLFLVRFILK
ncbi:MAG: PP2C family serine/threonine-protein phosphatase [Planctomycetota bacterium]